MPDPPGAPLYQQIARRVCDDVGTSLAPGDRLPSERTLCERYDVSRVTLRSALNLLAQDGIVTSAAARGWFMGKRPRTGTRHRDLFGFTDLATSLGQATSATVLQAVTRQATIDESEQFEMVPGSPVFVLRRLRRLEGLIIAVDQSRIPLGLCPELERHDFSQTSLYKVLRSAANPVQPTLANYAVEAVAPSLEEVELLELPPTVPLLVATQQTRDQLGRLFELGRTSYRGDRYRFRASIGTG